MATIKKIRQKKILLASWISFTGNLIMALAKIVVGFVTGSLAVLGDGIDSAVDVAMSAVTIITAHVMRRPPDNKYAYGYEKADSIAAKVLSFFIFFAGAQLMIFSIKRFFSDEPHFIPGILAVYVTLFSIAGKVSLSLYQYRVGRQVNSKMLVANAKNMKYDVGISLTVLLGLYVTRIFDFPLFDPITALFVSLWVLKGAYGIFKDSSVQLMDGVDNARDVYEKVFSAVSRVKGALNPHRLRIRPIGYQYMVVIDIEVDGELSLNEAHEIVREVELQIRKSIDVYDIVVHMDPTNTIEDELPGVTRDDFN